MVKAKKPQKTSLFIAPFLENKENHIYLISLLNLKMVKRIIVSLDEGFLKNFDEMIKKNGYTTRNSAVQEALRDFTNKLNERTILKIKVEKDVSEKLNP